jgi:phosphatidylethanolamine-binding protein (PEBP) family uncharacterized protein
MELRSSAFEHKGRIPAGPTRDGADVPPPLAGSELIEAVQSPALIVDESDAPGPAPTMTSDHRVPCDPPIPDGGLSKARRAAGPLVRRHHSFHKPYALNTVSSDAAHPAKAALETAMESDFRARAGPAGICRQ